MVQAISLRSFIMRTAFNPSTVRVEFMINEVTLREVALRLLHTFPCQYNSTDLPPSSSLSIADAVVATRFAQVSWKNSNTHVVYLHTRLTATGVLRQSLKKRDSKLGKRN